MAKRIKFILPLLALPLSVVSFAVFGNSQKVEEVDAYSTSSLPTTIDLNDCTASEIRNYYSSLNSLSDSERQGTNLLKNLKTILKNGQKYFSYDSGNGIWQMYEITDRDWEKSPASSTTYGTYNPSTNKITNYTYGSNSNPKNDPYVHALYINRNIENQTKAWGNHKQDEWGINREHVWPKAEGFETEADGGARGDPMHLMAGNGYSNNIHSNYYYGYVNTSNSYTNCGSKYSNQNGNLLGKSKTLGGSTSVFEPQDCDKGDIARAIFYMVARYNYLSGSDSDGINSNNPNLALTQSLSDWSSTGYVSSTSRTGKMGVLTDLLAWHHADPVDEYEIHRNNLLYKNYTNNRNPFIDFPEWADFIWGTAIYSGNTYQSYIEDPTGKATPSSDTINGYNTESSIAVTGVSLDKASLTLSLGGNASLSATVSPSDATNKAVSWTSSNTSVATVSSSGLVTAKAAGNATITVTTADGNKTATCSITVNDKSLSYITVSGQTTSFDVGDEFSFDGTVTAHFNDSSSSNVTNLASFTGYNMSMSGNQTVTVTYEGKTTTYQITVNAGSGSEDSEVTGSIFAIGSKLEGWTLHGAGSYSDGSVKLDSSGDYVLNNSLFTGNASEHMFNLIVTVNGKINGTDSSSNSFKVEALDSSGNVLDSKTYTKTIGTNYSNLEFEIDSNLSGCTGIKITYLNKSSGNWGIKSISWVASYHGSDPVATSITATAEGDYYVGDFITKSDITVIDDLSVVRDDFDFEDYQFTFEDTDGGSEKTVVEFPIIIGLLETTLEVDVYRKEYDDTIMVSDTLNQSVTGISETSYTSFSDKVVNSDAVYAGKCAGKYSSIQLNNTYSDAGVIMTASGGKVARIRVVINSNTLNTRTLLVYGKNTAYSSPTDLYDVDLQGTLLATITKDSANDPVDLVLENDYTYVGFAAGSGAIYIDSITIQYSELAGNLANYIMLEDTENQCSTKFDIAKAHFDGLSVTERQLFMNSDDYIISSARARLEAWAINQGKEIIYVNGDYVVENNRTNGLNIINNEDTPMIIIVVIASAISLIACVAFITRRKRNGMRIL